MNYDLDSIISASRRIKAFAQNNGGIEAELAILEIPEAYTVKKEYSSLEYKAGKRIRRHAFVSINPVSREKYAAVFTNTVPGWIETLSSGDDKENISTKRFYSEQNLSKIGVLYVLNEIMERIDDDQKELSSLQLTLKTRITLKLSSDLEKTKEYIVPMARKNANSIDTCWHIYPEKDSDSVILFEHPTYINMLTGPWKFSQAFSG